MIVTEEQKVGRRTFIHTYSDANRYVVRDGFSYEDTWDPKATHREYTEGDPIEE